ncbi:NUDIX hydrolase [Fusibacillus kribbianus]|uniref:NUDIX hydrolase n=1 Tax=Fusibacillus kribbianus TaxID=3044208 RepID=A0AAP4EY28_9FIRM|nr:NUDIX hydrolase [Ruminococcus sp. YH-rum2234]MDI9243114.1 NUDIX hydrolase [Ruminococcus sp. YH-rum2234]
MMEDIRRIRRELVYKGKILNFYEDYMALPNGNTAVWDFIEHKGAAAVVPVTSDGKILMVRQYRNALERYTLEIPAGAVNYLGEPKEECAARELEEETGYRAGKLEWLMNVNTTVAFCNELIGIYVAQDLIPTSQHLDEDEFLNVEKHDLDELLAMVYDGRITDGKTAAALLAYRVKYR